MTVSLRDERLAAGPISATQNQLLGYLREHGETEFKRLRTEHSFIRSVYYKAADDMKTLGVVDFNFSDVAVAA
ncbi:MAG: hypothetical protein AAGC93_16690 [Cyanobacteria bacterium P01_F01_bin.53]